MSAVCPHPRSDPRRYAATAALNDTARRIAPSGETDTGTGSADGETRLAEGGGGSAGSAIGEMRLDERGGAATGSVIGETRLAERGGALWGTVRVGNWNRAKGDRVYRAVYRAVYRDPYKTPYRARGAYRDRRHPYVLPIGPSERSGAPTETHIGPLWVPL